MGRKEKDTMRKIRKNGLILISSKVYIKITPRLEGYFIVIKE